MSDPEPGDRIELVHLDNDPHPLSPGTRGTIRSVERLGIYGDCALALSVKWDNGRWLGLIVPPDQFRKLEPEA